MVVKSIPVVESAAVSGQAPLVRNDEVTPPGYEKIVKGLKKSGKVDNPWAVAWSMKSKGIKPKTSEGGPGSGRHPEGGHRIVNDPGRYAPGPKDWHLGRKPEDVEMINRIAKNQGQPPHLVAARVDYDPQIKQDYVADQKFRARIQGEKGLGSNYVPKEGPLDFSGKPFRGPLQGPAKGEPVNPKRPIPKYPKSSRTDESAPVASGQCHDELAEACMCPDCKKTENGVPSQLLHDETPKVPVKSFRDDIIRKTKLRKVMGKKPDPNDGPVYQAEATFANPPGPIPKPFKKNSKDEVVGDYAPGKRYSKTTEAVPSSFNDDPAGMDDTSDLDLGMLDPDDNEEIPTGDDQMWTKEEVNYRYSGDKFESCGNCVHFKFPGSCEIIAGPVRSVDVCDKFEAEDEDKGEPFGWENPPEESEDAHSVNDQTVPSTLVPLKDKNVVQAVLAEGHGGFGKSYGMVTTDTRGGDAFGRRGSKNDDVVKSRRPSFGPASAWGMVTGDEGGPGSGRHKFAPEHPESDEDKQVSAFTRREKPEQRAARIASKKVDPATAKALRKALTSEGGPGSGRHPGPGITVHGTQEHPSKGPHILFSDHVTGSTMMLPQAQATPENIQAKVVAKRREFYGDPTERRQAMKKSFASEESAAISALTRRLVEEYVGFDKLKKKLSGRKGVTDPGALAATIGRKKYGAKGMAKKAAAGRKKTSVSEAPGEFMPLGPGKTAGDASGKMAYEPTQRNKKFKGFRDSGKKVAPEA